MQRKIKILFILHLQVIIQIGNGETSKLRSPTIILPEATSNSSNNYEVDAIEIVTPSYGVQEENIEIYSTIHDEPFEKKEKRILNISHWEEVTRFNLTDSHQVIKYVSKLTGMTIVLTESDSPIVNGYFCLATEAHNNDGLPHTLEHLIFLGSEDYPYKEVLDLLANRCLADRTNAWTDTDHTCYTVYTAGFSGFLNILPVYIDHILFPLLREEDFLTEVHHVNGNGIDSGVVYSEMQGVENTASNIMYFALAKMIYPGDSGYDVETGGYLKNLRESTNIQKVREYHKKFYQSENILLTITGVIDKKSLFRTLLKSEMKILQKKEENNYTRPWQSQLVDIKKDQPNEIIVEIPANDETIGNVAVAWRLKENLSNQIPMVQAYSLLLKYVASSQVSPLESEFVETQNPLATSVNADILKLKIPALLIEYENVPVNAIDNIVPKMIQIFKKIVNDGPLEFDIERIQNFIKREILHHNKEVEENPDLFVPDATVLDFLYGEKPSHLKNFTLSSFYYKDLSKKKSDYWIELIEQVFIKNKHYIVKGTPSIRKLEQLKREEKKRIDSQKKNLGQKGLNEKKDLLEKAIESQKLPSNEVLESIPFGNVDTIKFRSFKSYNYTSDTVISFKDIPIKLHLDDIKSNFVEIYVLMKTSFLTEREKNFLPLLQDIWLNLPISKENITMEIEDVVKIRSKTLLSISNSLGFDGATFSPGAFSETYVIQGQLEIMKFKEGINYLSDAINYPLFTIKKIRSATNNLLNSIPSIKQKSTSVLRSLFDIIYFKENSNIIYSSFLRQNTFLKNLSIELESHPSDIKREMETIVQKLSIVNNGFCYIGADIETLVSFYGEDIRPLKYLFRTSNESLDVSERFITPSEYVFRNEKNKKKNHVIYGLHGSESCYFMQGIYYNNTDWSHEDVANIRVMLQYLSDRFYNEVRGAGLAYGVKMSLSVTEGRITLSISRTPRLMDTYRL